MRNVKIGTTEKSYFFDTGNCWHNLNSIDRLNIIEWLDEAQTERNLWHRRFNNLYNELSTLNEYEKSGDKEAYLSNQFRLIHVKELLDNDNPIDALIEKHKVHERYDAAGMFGD